MRWSVVGPGLALGLGGLLLVRGSLGAQADLFEQRCATCHGKDGQAQTPAGKAMNVKPWKEDTALKKMSDTRIKEAIRDGVKENGKLRMPPNKNLTDEQLDELVKQVRSLTK